MVEASVLAVEESVKQVLTMYLDSKHPVGNWA